MVEFNAEAAAAQGFTPQDIAEIQQRISAATSAGISPEDIRAQLAQIRPGQYTPLETSARIPLGLVRAAGEGLAYGLGFPGQLESLGQQYITNPLTRMAGGWLGTPEEDSVRTIFPRPEQIMSASREVANKLGFPSGAQLTPQSSVERFAEAGVSGLASMAPWALGSRLATAGVNALRGTNLIPAQVLPLLAGGAGGALAAEGVHEAGGGTPLQLGAGAAASLLASRYGGMGISQVISSLGSAKTPQAAGIALQDAAKSWRENDFPAGIATAEAPMVAAIPARAEWFPASTVNNIDLLLARGGGVANATRRFIEDSIRSGGRIGYIAENVAAASGDNKLAQLAKFPLPEILTFEDGRGFRTELGNALANVSRPIDKQALKFIYSGATEDLGTTARANGAGDLFDAFNAESTRLHAINEGPIEKILSKDPEFAATGFLTGKGRPTELSQLRSAGGPMPEAVDELAAAHLTGDPTGKAWQRFYPETREALVPNPRFREIISSASQPAGGLPETAKEQLDLWLGGALGAIGGHFMAPGLSPYVSSALGEIGGALRQPLVRGAARIISNPLALTPGIVGAETIP